MKLLLDTHSLVWALQDSGDLSVRARQALQSADVWVSVASLWELLLKKNRRGALVGDPAPWWDEYVMEAGLQIMGIQNRHVLALDQLPDHHSDPFDRILVAQALSEGCSLVTQDRALKQYGVEIVW